MDIFGYAFYGRRIFIIIFLLLFIQFFLSDCSGIKNGFNNESIPLVNEKIQREFPKKAVDSNITTLPKTYYISNRGDDNFQGTNLNFPIASIDKIQKININPGDSILFECGGVWRGQLNLNFSGTHNQKIYIGSYGKGPKPIFNGATDANSWTKESNTIWSTKCNKLESPYWTVVVKDGQQLSLVGQLNELDREEEYFIEESNRRIYLFSYHTPANDIVEISEYQHGINIRGQQYIKIEGLDFRQYGYSGIILRDSQPKGFIIINKCDFSNNKMNGFAILDGHNNNTISNCTARYNGNGFYSIRSHKNRFVRDTVEFNISYSADGMFTDGHGIGLFRSSDCVVEYCYGNSNEGGSVGFDPDADNIEAAFGAVFRYNYFKGAMNSSACIGIQDLQEGATLEVYYNLIVNDLKNKEPGFGIYSGFEIKGKLLAYNNTIVQGEASSYRTAAFRYGKNVFFINNLIYSTQSKGTLVEVLSKKGLYSDYNLYYKSVGKNLFKNVSSDYNTLDSWKKGTKQDKNSIIKDPLLRDDFSLSKDSPAIDSGLPVGLSKDRLGNTIIGKPDIGCHEFQF